jgi:hypothetical protein
MVKNSTKHFSNKIDTQKNRVFRVSIEYDTRKNRVFRVWVGCRVPYSILTRKLKKNRVRMYG